ncbi:MAG: alpha/beta hydrolase [Deltaproteobacteria bacterium]|nr:alpha/beta hydrolase [Deltaproteobacteria bacterium]
MQGVGRVCRPSAYDFWAGEGMRRFTLRSARGETSGIAFGPKGSVDGPPDLVFLHATGFNALTYRPLLEPLGERFRVIALDLRGHGRSRLPRDPDRLTTLWIYARDLLAMLRALRLERPPILSGHSLGGLVSITACAARRGIAERLVLVDPVLPPWRFSHRYQPLHRLADRIALLPIAQGAARRRGRFATKPEAVAAYRQRPTFAGWAPGFLEGYVEDGFVDAEDGGIRLSCTPAWEAASFAALRHDIPALLGRIRAPVEILRAERESTVRESEARLKRLKPDLVMDTIAGASHFLPMEQPEPVRARLLAALEARAGARVAEPHREVAHVG